MLSSLTFSISREKKIPGIARVRNSDINLIDAKLIKQSLGEDVTGKLTWKKIRGTLRALLHLTERREDLYDVKRLNGRILRGYALHCDTEYSNPQCTCEYVDFRQPHRRSVTQQSRRRLCRATFPANSFCSAQFRCRVRSIGRQSLAIKAVQVRSLIALNHIGRRGKETRYIVTITCR